MNVPNTLVYTRMALTVPVWYLIVFTELKWVALTIFAIAGLTDTLDGYLARRNGSTSLYGAFIDMTADKIFVIGTLFALVEIDRVWGWVGIVIATRELAFVTIRSIAAIDNKLLPSTKWGKFKMWVQCVAIGLAIANFDLRFGMLLHEWMMVVAVAYTIVSAGFFFRKYSSNVFREGGDI